ncbi:hypothetical protein [Dyadobacter sp. LHD-138]|uniref:hypothetical protein n=1 Tax=Dyadobacter sp. LHD-138 TaxID=3071413 RepID=UPI0027E003C1|nr:hypothetical protein [Dyadobacter sp. LHD-138]MDQ6482036.1 hypothetical protein [Dyadobacter sp. LHD-138]
MENANVATFLFFVSLLGGGIKRAAENMEADILSIKLPDSVLIAPAVISNTTIPAFVKYDKMNIKAFAPDFVLTTGARINPKTGIAQDFPTPVTYTVRSEDGNWQKQYRVSLLQNTVSGNFVFENWTRTSEANYKTPYEVALGRQQNV